MIGSERLDGDGSVIPASGLIDAQLQTDRYTLAGKGIERWEPSFGYRGFRYVQVEGLAGTPPELTRCARIVHSNVARTGSFASADPLLGKIDAAAIATILNNLHGFQTDTPTYEKNGWTGDAQASAGAAARSLDVARVWTKWLADFRDAQAPSGELPEIVPATPYYGYDKTPGWNLIWGPTTPWDVAALILPWELYSSFGDTRVLAQNHDMQRRLVDYTATFIKAPDFRRAAGLSEWAPPAAWTSPMPVAAGWMRSRPPISSSRPICWPSPPQSSAMRRMRRSYRALAEAIRTPTMRAIGTAPWLVPDRR
jgi:alpha-L-rhamnosidase